MNDTVVYNVRPSALSIFGAVCGVLFAFGVLATRENAEMWPMVLIPVVTYLGAFAWLSQLRLEFRPDRLVYASMVTRERAVFYSSIKSVRLVRGSSLFAARNTALIVTLGGDHIRINVRLFPPEAGRRLLALKAA